MPPLKQPFEQVVAAHGATVLRVCRALVGPSDADDAWSETFLRALRAYPRLAADAAVRAWLVTIAHHTAVDLLRARQRRAVPVGQVPDRASTLGVPGEADGSVWGAVGRLPDRQRQALAYHYLGGLPFAEIAGIVGGTAEAVRRAASDGRSRLRVMLAEPEGADR